MGALDSIETWTFDGLTYARKVDGSPWDTEPAAEAIFKKDPVLDNGMFFDIGGSTWGAYQHTAVFETMAERDTFAAKWGHDGTHVNLQGTSWQAALVRIQKQNGSDGFFYLICTFEKVA